ncbi:hypothetical protein D0C16_01010 [Cellvibrio sp. KY-GH-1]|nr:hypothetical protein D0C16_01010 [Cellvibrio sp. KY-GH-1]
MSGGNAASSADGRNIVWALGDTTAAFVSTALGSTWIVISCLRAGSIVEVDRSDKDPTFKVSPAANLPLSSPFQSPFCYLVSGWSRCNSLCTQSG